MPSPPATPHPHTTSSPHPNLLFVFADQLRASSLACYREEPVLTPALDLLASQGDNEHDPYQMTNLLDAAANPRAAVPPELDRQLDHWLDQTSDYFGGNEDYQACVDLATGLVTRPEGLQQR